MRDHSAGVASMSRVCSTGCGTGLGSKNTTGMCRACRGRAQFADPSFKTKQKIAVAEFNKRPEVRAARSARLVERNRNLSEAEKQRQRENGRMIAQKYLMTPEGKAISNSPEARRKKGATITATRYADIPAHLRDEVRRLNRQQHIPAAEARRMVLDQAEHAERRRIAALTPFERDMERIAKGAAIVEQFTPRKAEHAFSIVGSALA